jgi:hypothetical protein
MTEQWLQWHQGAVAASRLGLLVAQLSLAACLCVCTCMPTLCRTLLLSQAAGKDAEVSL